MGILSIFRRPANTEPPIVHVEPDPRDVAQAEYRAACDVVRAARESGDTRALHHARERQMEALHKCLKVGA